MAIVINSTTGEIDLNATTQGIYEVTYTTNGSCPTTVKNTITVNALDGATFAYSSNSFTQTGTASLTTTPTTSGGVYSAYPSGLSINSSTGEIDLANSTIQSYKIFYETSGAGCPNSSTFDLAVTASGISNVYSMNLDAASSDYLTTNNSSISGVNNASISLWVKPTGSTSNQYKAIINQWEAVNSAWGIWLNGHGSTYAIHWNQAGSIGINSSSIIPNDQWSHIAIVKNATNLKMFHNGSEVNSFNVTAATGSNATTLNIGAQYTTGTASTFFNGKIDEVGIWNTNLSSTQIQSIYDATSAGLTKDLSTIEPSNLKYWNRMGD